MLTIKQITENTEAVLRGLEKSISRMQKRRLTKSSPSTTRDVLRKTY